MCLNKVYLNTLKLDKFSNFKVFFSKYSAVETTNFLLKLGKEGNNMKIIIEKNLEEKLVQFNKKNILILNLNDGIGLFSDQQATCSLSILFDLISLNKRATIDLKKYNYYVMTNVGKIRMKDYSVDYLDEVNYLEINKFGSISLIGEYSGLIDGNVRLINKSSIK